MPEESLNSKIVALGISKSYASEIVSGVRKPSLPLAIKIFRAINVKFGPIADASLEEIQALESVSRTQRDTNAPKGLASGTHADQARRNPRWKAALQS